MIILATTRDGFFELEPVIKTGKHPVWIGSDVLSETELAEYRTNGIDLTNFNFSINPENKEEVEDALATISEHHPNERVWQECLPKI